MCNFEILVTFYLDGYSVFLFSRRMIAVPRTGESIEHHNKVYVVREINWILNDKREAQIFIKLEEAE